MKIPLLLNFAQCKLMKKEYYSVIEHCTTVLKMEPDNVKALYRRGKAYIGTWDEDKATYDLKRVIELDPSLQNIIDKELQVFSESIKQKDKMQQRKLVQMFK